MLMVTKMRKGNALWNQRGRLDRLRERKEKKGRKKIT